MAHLFGEVEGGAAYRHQGQPGLGWGVAGSLGEVEEAAKSQELSNGNPAARRAMLPWILHHWNGWQRLIRPSPWLRVSPALVPAEDFSQLDPLCLFQGGSTGSGNSTGLP